MFRYIGILLTIIVAGGLFYFKSYITDNVSQSIQPGEVVIQNQKAFDDIKGEVEPVDYTIESFAENLFVPWSIVFTSPDRMLVTERNGKIRVIKDSILKAQPLITFPEVSSQAEEGLMGLTLDPDYSSNNTLYACLAYEKNGKLVDKIVSLTDNIDSISVNNIILDDIPAARFHAGCRIKFGPDDKLYITTGDATSKDLAQNLDSLAGKILRINSDGTSPEDNPFPNSPIWTLGHRNPQGIDWHPVSNNLWSSEHGPSTFDGPPGGDEINQILKGENYGWPVVSHEKSQEGLIDPVLVFTPATAPGSALFYSGDVFPQFKNNLFYGALKGEGIIRIVLSDPSEEVVSYENLKDINVGRIREVTQGPDGLIYFATSNMDGRGEIRTGDDKIYRIIPK